MRNYYQQPDPEPEQDTQPAAKPAAPAQPAQPAQPASAPAVEAAEALPRPRAADGPLSGLTSASPETLRLAAELIRQVEAGTLPDHEVEMDAARELEQRRLAVEKRRVQFMLREAQLRQRYQEEAAEARRQKKPLPPIRTATRDHCIDASIPLDRDGKLAGEPGEHLRWVRTTDASGRPSSARATAMIQWGYRPVKSRVDGEPITQWAHVLMATSVEAEAERKAYHEKDLVGTNRRVEEDWANHLESLNRSANRTAFIQNEASISRGVDVTPVFSDERPDF